MAKAVGSHHRLLEYWRTLSWAALQGHFHCGLDQVFLCNLFLLFLKVKETSFLRNTIAECQACGKCFCGDLLILRVVVAVQTKDLKQSHMTATSGSPARELKGREIICGSHITFFVSYILHMN